MLGPFPGLGGSRVGRQGRLQVEDLGARSVPVLSERILFSQRLPAREAMFISCLALGAVSADL